MNNIAPDIGAENRYRTASETQIVDMLLVAAFVFELENGQREKAIARVTTALDDWIRLGLGFRMSERGERLFDPVEVVNRMKEAGHQGLDRFWLDHFVATSRAFAREWETSAAASASPRSLDAARFSLTLLRRFNLTGMECGQKLRLRLPLPLTQSSEGVEIEPIVAAELSARVTRSEGRLDFQLAAPSAPVVDIAAVMSFTTNGRSTDGLQHEPGSDGSGIYVRPADGLIRVTPRVHELARALAGAERRSLALATRFFHYIIDELMCGMVHYDQVNAEAPGDWVLDHGWYDCQLGSALLVSMCRAYGIPARILSGHMLYRLAPGFHYWAEVWIDGQGWTPFDFLTWDLSEAGRNAAWRDHFAGAVDYRMVTQCFPLRFTGPMSVRLPAAWHLLNAPARDGMEISFTDLDGKLLYCDHVASRKLQD